MVAVLPFCAFVASAEVDLDDSIHGAGVDEGQARTNTFAEIAPCPRCQAESDAVSLVRHCQWYGESQVVGCGRGAPCCPELRHRVDLWAVLAEGPDNRRRDPTEALDLSGDRRGSGVWEEGSVELSCGGVPLFDGLARSRFHPPTCRRCWQSGRRTKRGRS